MGNRATNQITRRDLLKAAGTGVAGLGLASMPGLAIGCSNKTQSDQGEYFPPSEHDGGWRVGDPTAMGVDARLHITTATMSPRATVVHSS